MNLSEMQSVHLANVKTRDVAYRSAKRDALARAKLLAADEIAAYLSARDYEVRLAFEAGVPKTRLCLEGLGTSDGKTLNDSLKRTEAAALSVAGKLSVDGSTERYRWSEDEHHLVVKLTGDALEAAAKLQDWTVAQAVGKGVDTAEFLVVERSDGSVFLDAVTEGFVPSVGLVHPIVFWAQDDANEAEALAWYSKEVSGRAQSAGPNT